MYCSYALSSNKSISRVSFLPIFLTGRGGGGYGGGRGGGGGGYGNSYGASGGGGGASSAWDQ